MSRGSIQATVTEVKLQLTGTVPGGVSQIDLRNVTLYELIGPAIQLAVSEYPSTITGNRVHIPVSLLSEYPIKRTIILDDGEPSPHIATVDSTEVSGGHLVISFTPALTSVFFDR